LARLNLNHDCLPEEVRSALTASDIHFPSRNMFHSIVARAVEIYYALLEAIRILADYQPAAMSYTPVLPQGGVAYGCTEAPRGILWHRYEVDAHGQILKARIVPPTSQNQARIEQDLRHGLQNFGLAKSDQALRLFGEQIIRNYDPCISCATHFLKLKVHRR